MTHDLRIAWRRAIGEGRFTGGAVLGLGLAIAITTTVYAFMYGQVLRDLPVRDPQHLVSIGTRVGSGPDLATVSYPDFDDFRRATTSFTGLVLFSDTAMNIIEPGYSAERFVGPYVTSNLFRLLGEQPIIGRDFQEQDDMDGAPAVVIISHRLWQRRYGRDPGVLGRQLLVNDQRATIIGVMAERVGFPSVAGVADLWLPLAQLPGARTRPRDARTFFAVGRLADGVTIAQAHADLSAIAARLSSQYPATNKDAQPTLLVYHDRFTAPQLRVVYFGLMSAAGVVLLIALVNVGALLIVRSAKRGHELGIRMALGGSRARLVREVAVDGILLGAASSVTGFGLSVAGVRLLSYGVADVSWMMPYWIRFEFDAPVLVFAVSLCAAVTVLLGLLSLGQLTSRQILTVIRPNSTPLRTRRAAVLIATDVVLTLTLLTGAGLMARSAVLLSRPNLAGIDTENWLTMRVALPQRKYATLQQRREFYRRLEDQLTSTAGVEAAAIMSHLPLGFGNVRRLTVDGRANVTGVEPTVTTVQISSGYFEAIGLVPSRGRALRDGDGASDLPPAVVNELFAATYFRAEDPLGHHIRLAIPSRPSEGLSMVIVGVVPNVRQRSLQQLMPDPIVYVPLASDPVAASAIVVRMQPPSAAARLVRGELDKIDRDLPLFQVMPFRQYLAGFFFTTRVVAAIFAVFGVIALAICAIGIYAVIGAALRQRQLEFGIRLAVGAHPHQLVWLIVRGTAIPMGIGLMVGGLGALGVGRALESVISQIPPNDAVTIAAALAGLAIVYVASVIQPAIRAAAVSPAPLLRHE